MTSSNDETIIIKIGDTVIELLGAEKEAFLAQRKLDNLETEKRKDAQIAKQVARQAVLDKLGLSADEAQALFG